MSKSTKKSKKNRKKRNRNERAMATKATATKVEEYNEHISKMMCSPNSDADVDLAQAFAMKHHCKAKCLGKDNWLFYNGERWVRDNGKVQKLVHKFLNDREKEIEEAKRKYRDVPHNERPYRKCSPPMGYSSNLKSSMKVAAIIREATPYMAASESDFDCEPYLLNTPDATYDLKRGMAGRQKHRAEDLIMMTTKVSPNTKGLSIWLKALDDFFGGDKDLIHYIQQVMGQACIGDVFREELIIALGNGGNGKSTFFEAIRQVLGDYAGGITSDVIMDTRYSDTDRVVPLLRKKRFVILTETRAGAKIDDGMLKRIVSIDQLFGNPKYKDSGCFAPSHTMVLPTNHMPIITATDYGTERRIKIVPFFAKFRETNKEGTKLDKKKYANYLVEEAGGAILQWLILGAQEMIANNFDVKMPNAVKELTESCLKANNWLKAFLESCCVEEMSSKAYSTPLYDKFKSFAKTHDYNVVSQKAFSLSLQEHGFKKSHDRTGNFFEGIRLKPEEGVDELPFGDAESDKPDEVDSASNPNEETKNTEPLDGDANPYFDTLI